MFRALNCCSSSGSRSSSSGSRRRRGLLSGSKGASISGGDGSSSRRRGEDDDQKENSSIRGTAEGRHRTGSGGKLLTGRQTDRQATGVVLSSLWIADSIRLVVVAGHVALVTCWAVPQPLQAEVIQLYETFRTLADSDRRDLVLKVSYRLRIEPLSPI